MSKFTQKHAQISFCSELKAKRPWNLIKKQSAVQKSSKNKQILIKTSSKTSNMQVLKKTANPQKNKPKFAGKPQGWQHWPPWLELDIFENLLPFYCYATKANSRTIRSRVSQPATACKGAYIVNCKLITVCYQNSEPDSCAVWVSCRQANCHCKN